MSRRGRTSLVPRVLLGLSALSLAAGSASAQSIPVRLAGEASSLVGLEISLPLEIDMTARAEKVGSVALALRWNPAVLKFLAGTNGNFGDLTVNEDSIPAGVLKMVGVNAAGVGGRVILGVGRFLPLVADTTTFQLSVGELYAAGTFADLLPSVTVSNRPYCPAIGRFADLDADQTAGSRDALLALAHGVGRDISGIGNAALGDVDGDGLTGARDALIILSAAVGLDVSAFRVFRVAPGPCATARRPALMLVPGATTLDLGQQLRMVAVAADSTGAGVATTDVVWSTSAPHVAAVDARGVVSAVGPGTAVISGSRIGGARAAATVTVARRRVHWVDALAFAGIEEQIGSAELPFATIQAAVNFARPGDTVRVRPGRYAEVVTIERGVIVEGDTAGGRPRPFIASPGGAFPRSFIIDATGRVELHRLRLDTVWNPVNVLKADTFVVRDLQLRASCTGGIGINLDATGVARIERSTLVGSGGSSVLACSSSNAVYAASVRVLAIDSSLIADFRDDAVYLDSVDSLFVRGSQIRDNYGAGVYHYCYGCGRGIAMVFSHNRMIQNGGGHVYSYDYYAYYYDSEGGVRSARFDHNVFIGGGYDGVTLYGDTGRTVVSLVADTFRVRDGSWMNLYQFDSLLVDSVVVAESGSYNDIQGGRIAVVRNSKFLELTGTAMYMEAYPRDSMHLEVRNVEFRGPDSTSCDRCGDAINFNDRVSLVIDSVVGVNLSTFLDLYDGSVTASNVTLQRVYDGFYVYCGSTRVRRSTITDVEYGFYANGCDPGDSLVVDSTTITRAYNAIESDDVAVVVTNSTFTNPEYEALDHDCGPVRWINNTVTNDGSYGYGEGVYAYGCDATDSLIVKRSTFAGQFYGALYSGYMPAIVDSNSFADSDENVDLWGAPAVVRDNVIVRPRYNDGIDVDGDGYGSVTVQRNTVTCAGTDQNEGISAEVNGQDTALVLDNAVTGCPGHGLWLNATSGGLVEAARNSVTLPDTANYGVYLTGDASGLARIAGNTVAGKARYGSIRLQGAMSRVYVDSNTVTGSIQAGIYAYSSIDTLAIRDNVIQNHAGGTCCVYYTGAIVLDGSAGNDVRAHVLRNRITRATNGIVLLRDFGDTVTVQVDSNTVRNVDSMGVWVLWYSRANIRKNALDSAAMDGVRLEQYSGVAPALVNFNNLTRNVQHGVRNAGAAGVIDATNNWWGDAGGPRCASGATGCTGAGDSVSASVTFSPFLAAPQGDVPAPAPRFVAAAPAAAPAVDLPRAFVATPSVRARQPRALELRDRRAVPSVVRAPKPALARARAPEGVNDPMVAADKRQAEQHAAAAAQREARIQARASQRAEREVRAAERVRVREGRRAEAEQRRGEREGRPQ
ncbi:MAG TPA: right-handed parallel beta-helix repeat-containing protein [Gemmatimonadales bacterium]|nr:right-handed parallel beta-helix repeat-containing protein [Gemmatimonadales bacterium]